MPMLLFHSMRHYRRKLYERGRSTRRPQLLANTRYLKEAGQTPWVNQYNPFPTYIQYEF